MFRFDPVLSRGKPSWGLVGSGHRSRYGSGIGLPPNGVTKMSQRASTFTRSLSQLSHRSTSSLKRQFSLEGLPNFTNARHQRLYCKYWNPKLDEDEEDPRGLVFIAHGFAEHSDWYDHVAEPLADRGLLVASHDHVGHGKSEGGRAHVERFDDYIDDLLHHVAIVQTSYRGIPTFIIGHSVGGTIALRTILKKQDLFKGLVVIGPTVLANTDAVPNWKIHVGKLVASIIPKLPMEKLDPKLISRDSAVVKKYSEDPLVYHGGMRTGWGLCLLHALDELQPRLPEVRTPLLVIQGEEDKICDASGARLLHQQSESQDKTLSIYPGAYHQVHNEPDGVGPRAILEIVNWITNRC